MGLLESIKKKENKKSLFKKGKDYFNKGEFHKAVEYYDKSLKIDPYQVKAWNYKALALGSINNYDESLVCFDRALDLDPGNINSWYGKGLIFAKSGNVQKALEHFDRALELNPDFKPAIDAKKLVKSINRIP